MEKNKHLMLVPFTGLGLYGGYRGDRWLKNRLQVFKQFVLPSLLNQTNKDFIVWFAWRDKEKSNPIVQEFRRFMLGQSLTSAFTFSGVPFYDDKYEDAEARDRVVDALSGAMGDLINVIGECDNVLMTIQPSDDLYHQHAVDFIQKQFEQHPKLQAVGFKRGYIMNYATKELAHYDPKTNPPFYTLKFPRETFIDPLAHMKYTGMKRRVGKYPIGTPLPSHEYVGDCLEYKQLEERGFLVGVHGENISTGFNNPYKTTDIENTDEIFLQFGILAVQPLKMKYSIRKRFLRMLPHPLQRKIRYIFGERIWNRIYSFLRS